MDVAGIAKFATTMAETGNKQEVALTMLKKQQDMQKSMATQLLDAVPPVQNLPAHLGKTINTTA